MDTNFITDSMLNNVLGPVAFYEMRDHQIEITRVNEQYFQLMGTSSGQANSYGKRFWNHVHADDRVLLHTIFEKAFRIRCPEQMDIFILCRWTARLFLYT